MRQTSAAARSGERRPSARPPLTMECRTPSINPFFIAGPVALETSILRHPQRDECWRALDRCGRKLLQPQRVHASPVRVAQRDRPRPMATVVMTVRGRLGAEKPLRRLLR